MGRGGRSRGRRAQDGGRPQGGPLQELLRQELRAALLPRPRGVSGTGLARRETQKPGEPQRRAEWQCGPCGTHNWLDRTSCRKCGKDKGAKREKPAPEAEKATTEKATTEKVEHERPPAPEVRAEHAEKQAAALELSAETLLAAGLGEQAEALKKKAAALRKQAAEQPAPGRRLDLPEGYVERCAKRAEKTKKAEEDARQAAEQTAKDREAADKELDEAKAKLEQLRKDLAAGHEATAMDAD